MDAASLTAIPPAQSLAELGELLRTVQSADQQLAAKMAAVAIVMQARSGSLEPNLGQQLDITV